MFKFWVAVFFIGRALHKVWFPFSFALTQVAYARAQVAFSRETGLPF